MIHRQEKRSLFGFAVSRHIDLEDAQTIIAGIKDTPEDMPIDFVIHTPGGLVPEKLMVQERVLIAGAGPVGLVAVAHLARGGVPVTVFEEGTRPIRGIPRLNVPSAHTRHAAYPRRGGTTDRARAQSAGISVSLEK
jgi:pyruvate/2-oxoglutarate dehydrogenase complex dihydrolipoamide dehydrogenase (E3) component